MLKVKLKDIIAPSFYNFHRDVKKDLHSHYWLDGGRGSTKSSVTSLEIILGIKRDSQQGIFSNAVVFRKVANTLRQSVYEQMCWAIDKLNLNSEFKATVSPMEITYIPTGQKILFKGCDDPLKVKSIKTAKGFFKYVWFEEVTEFNDYAEIRNILQSLLRGGKNQKVFYTFNPPESQRNWCNEEILKQRNDKFVHHSTYLSVPKEWLGEQFLAEAEYLKETNYTKYEHEYLGKVTGTGRDIFNNITIRPITDDEIRNFDRIYNGVDFGWFPDPWAFNRMYFNANQKRLYIYDEGHENKKSNKQTYEIMVNRHGIKRNDKVTCDSAEEKSIADYKAYGLYARGAVKGPGSVEYSMKWLQSLNEIIIDNKRCPFTAKEFLEYEYEIDKDGNIIDGYPDKDNHHIDACRYALNDIWRRRGR